MSQKQLEFDRQLDITTIREYRRTKKPVILSEIYQKYVLLVYGVCLKYLTKRELAKDTVKNIYMALPAKVQKTDIGNFREWLYGYTIKVCNDILSKSKIGNE
jgi:RNA polymerase sigma-70 factor (ECF subfamily)